MNMTTRLTVAADGTISTENFLPKGEYIVDVWGKDGVTPPSHPLQIEDWPKLDLTPRDPNATYSRDEIYDDGR